MVFLYINMGTKHKQENKSERQKIKRVGSGEKRKE
jgi:hypothetical protein